MMTQVLVVDDVPAMAEQYAYDLKRVGGYSAIVAAGGDEALDILGREPVDCVVLDLEMPGIDGFEVLRRLQQRGIDTPVIVYTGAGNYDRCIQAVRLGAYGFVDKADPIERVVQEIENAVSRGRLVRELHTLRSRFDGDTPWQPCMSTTAGKAPPPPGRYSSAVMRSAAPGVALSKETAADAQPANTTEAARAAARSLPSMCPSIHRSIGIESRHDEFRASRRLQRLPLTLVLSGGGSPPTTARGHRPGAEHRAPRVPAPSDTRPRGALQGHVPRGRLAALRGPAHEVRRRDGVTE